MGNVRITFMNKNQLDELWRLWSVPALNYSVISNLTFYVFSKEEAFDAVKVEEDEINWESGECPDMESALESINWEEEIIVVCADVNEDNLMVLAFQMVHEILTEKIKLESAPEVRKWMEEVIPQRKAARSMMN